MAGLGFPETYRVGGSVRDQLLGRPSKDSDYMIRGTKLADIHAALTSTDAKISALKLRDNRETVGWRAHVKGLGLIEIMLPRTEKSTGPGHRDFKIVCDQDISLAEDAARRDFTINALYINVHTQVTIDPLGMGEIDLICKRINTTHPDSFRDDPLRILRALRFMSKLEGFRMNEATEFQMKAYADAVHGLTDKGVSGTALTELCGILMGSRPGAALRVGTEVGAIQVLLPELTEMLDFDQRSRYHDKSTSEHTWACLEAAAAMHSHAPLRVRMALLFHDCGKPTMAWAGEDGVQHYYGLDPKRAVELGASAHSLMPHEFWSAKFAGEALKRLNAPKDLRRDVVQLIERHMLPIWENIKPYKVRKWRAEIGDGMLRDLITHRTCDVLGKGGTPPTDQLEVLAWIADQQQRAIDQKVPKNVKELDIDGHGLIRLGIEGRQIGEVQRKLLDEVIAQPKLNNRAWLEGRAEQLCREAAS